MRLLIAICLLLSLPGFAQEGVVFSNLTLEEALQKAKTENKLVFMDCYTSWCGPCKRMAEKEFPKKEAGDFFNSRFVNVKYDMEKGNGVDIAQKYGIKAYPTFIILRPDGTVQHRLVGSDDITDFIKRVEIGLNENTSLAHLNEIYDQGEMNVEELMNYKIALSEAGEDDKASKIQKEILSQLNDTEKTLAKYWPLYEDDSCQIGTPLFNFLLSHLSEIRRNTGKEKVDEYLFERYASILQDYMLGYQNKNAVPVNLLQKQVPTLNIGQQKTLDTMLSLAVMVAERDTAQLVALIKEKIPTCPAEVLKTYVFTYRGILWQTEDYEKQEGFTTINRQLAKQIIQHMKQKTDSLSAKELETYYIIITTFGDAMEAVDYKELADIGKKVITRLPQDEETENLQYTIDRFEKQALN